MQDETLNALVEAIERRESVALISVTEATGSLATATGQRLLLWADDSREPLGELALGDELAARVVRDARRALDVRDHRHLDYATDEGTVKLFVEVQAQPPHLIVVGAGHIAVPLAQIGKINDFSVTVLDDRPQYAHPSRFPTADRVIAGDFRTELAALRDANLLDRHTYIVLVTRGHQYDVDSLLEVLDDDLAYIGMIGSQRRVRAVFELLEREQNIPPQKFDGIYAPIGIDIGARTPAEIAVCIMAEIINVLRSGPALSMSEQIRRDRQARRERAATR